MQYVKLLESLFRLKRNEKKSRKQIEKLQDRKLQELILFAFHNSEYYQEIFTKAGINEENIRQKSIKDFPTIDKSDFIENFDRLITVKDVTQESMRHFDAQETERKELFKGKYHLIHSSGSTGLPAYFLYDEKAWNTMLAGIIRAALWDMSWLEIIKFLIEKPRIMYLAATDGRYGGAMAVGDGVDGVRMEQMHLDVQSPLRKWIEKVNAFKPNILIGYPSAIKILGEQVEKKKLSVDIGRVITCGEPLHQNLETWFQEVFQCETVNVYGASESVALGAGISGTEGICLFDDLNLIEVENEKIYLTCLYNYVQPIIRYCISDELEFLEQKNRKNAFTWVKTILGRNEDLMWFTDEDGNQDFLHPLSIEGICVLGLRDYQFRKLDCKTFEMIAEIDVDGDRTAIEKEVKSKVEKILKEKRLSYVSFRVKFVDCIYPDTTTGKKKLILT